MKRPELIDATLELNNRVALLTFNRDDVRNALTGTSLAEDIVAAAKWANDNPEVSILVMTGAGSAFSAGGNIKEMQERTGTFSGTVLAIQDKYRRGIQQIPRILHQVDIPLIAAVNGPAIGAGLDLACMCDLRIGSSKALVGETFINLGIIPGAGGAWLLQRLLGYQRAVELTLTGRLVKAREALELGIFLEVVEPEALLPRALELAGQIAAQPPLTVRMTKRLMKQAQTQGLPEALDLASYFQAMMHHTEDHQEAIRAFLEKRPGHYSGR